MSVIQAVLLLVSLAVGLVGLATLVQTTSPRTVPLSKYIRLGLLFFNILILFGIGLNYLENSTALDQRQYSIILFVSLLLMTVFKFGFVHSLWGVSKWLRQKGFSRQQLRVTFVFYTLVVVGLALTMVWNLIQGFGSIANWAVLFVELIIFTAILAIGFQLILVRKDVSLTTAANQFAIINLAVFTFVSLGALLPFIADSSYLAVYNAVLLLLYNLFLVVWALRYLPIFVQISRQDNQVVSLNIVGKKFGISKRELEVVDLICQGKTNQEIADSLFISLQTVKDHNHNIFRKVRVTNRTQLASVFASGRSQ